MTHLHNLQIGSDTVERVSYRFRALQSGQIQSLTLYFGGDANPNDGGYADGDGGRYLIRVVPDNGSGLPNLNSVPAATFTYIPRTTNPERIQTLNTALAGTALQQGQVYHVVLENTHANPTRNFISVDMSSVDAAGRGYPLRWLSVNDWAALYQPRGSNTWRNATESGTQNQDHMAPILQITLRGGYNWGNAVIQSGATTDRIWTATAATPVREVITPKTDKIIQAFSVATATPTGGALDWSLQSAGGQVLQTGTINQTSANRRTEPARNTTMPQWYDVDLRLDVSLKAHSTYYLVFTPRSGSR